MRSVQVLDRYDRWLKDTPLAARSQANYRRWVVQLVEDLDAPGELATFLAPGGEPDRRATLTDWRRRLVDGGLAPATVNLALAAATSLLDCHALPSPTVSRVQLAAGEHARSRSSSCARSRRRSIV